MSLKNVQKNEKMDRPSLPYSMVAMMLHDSLEEERNESAGNDVATVSIKRL